MSFNVTNYEDFITIISEPIMKETCKKPPPRLLKFCMHLWTRVCHRVLAEVKEKCRVWDSNSGLQALYVVAINLGPSYPVLTYQNNTKNYLKRLLKFLLCIYLKLDFLLTIQSKQQTVDIDKQIQLPFIKTLKRFF